MDSNQILNSLRPEHIGLLEAARLALHSHKRRFSLRRRDDLDQCPATTETVLRRLAVLLQSGLPSGAKVLLLGDDDLLSIAIAGSAVPFQLTLVDADSELLDSIKANLAAGQTVEVLHLDLRDQLPISLTCKFDAVFTDPPYTLAGELLFLHRAMLALASAGTPSVYLCGSRLYLTPREAQRIHAFARAGGLLLSASYEDLNVYAPPPDVRVDIKNHVPQWKDGLLRSSLWHLVRRRALGVPALPREALADIYEYDSRFSATTHNGTA